MKVNGQEIGMESLDAIFSKVGNLQHQDEVNKIAEQEDRVTKYKFAISECNRIAEIPNRYSKCLLGQYEYFSPKGNNISELVKNFAYKPSDRTLLVCGPTGVGKTSLMCATLHERAIQELPAGLYFNNRYLMAKLRTCRSFSAKENEEYFLRRLSTVPFLCIDEVGACSNMKEEMEFMTFIICARYDNSLPTYISTNLDQVNFALLISGIDYTEYSNNRNLAVEKVKEMTKYNATLDRFNSTAIVTSLVTDSHRENKNGR